MQWFYNYRYYIVVFLLSLLPFIFWIDPATLSHTHDGLVHLPRMAAFFKALSDFNIPVRWAGELNYGYGMPLFIFIYHTPYLVSSFFLLIGVGLVSSFKLTLLISFLLSGFSMFLFSKKMFGDDRTALVTTVLYQFAPFHLIDLLIRGSFGEVFTYAFLPFVLYGLISFFQTKKILYLLFVAIFTGLLIISHNSISLLFFGIACLFTLFFAKNIKQAFFGSLSLFGGLILSAYYWIPALLEHKYTYGNLYMENLFRDRFPALWKMVVPNITDTKELLIDGLALQVGIVHLVAIVVAVFWFMTKKKKNIMHLKLFFFSSVLCILAIVFMHPFSIPVWDHISILRQFQFPWRFLTIIVVVSSLLGVFLRPYLKNTYVFSFLLSIVVASSVIYWFPKEGYDRLNESYYWDFPLNTTYYGETDVIWSAGPATSYPENRIEVVSGEGTVTNLEVENNKQSFMIDTLDQLTVVSNTQYFPGWRAFSIQDNKRTELPIQFQDPNYRGLIQFTLPAGNYDVEIIFGESKLRFVSNMVSLVGFGGLLFLTIFIRNRKI